MKKLTQAETKRLKKSFWKGFFFMFDLSWMISTKPPELPIIENSVREALAKDWRTVGNYLRMAMGQKPV